MTAHKRRWTFSLRTMFVVVTVLGILGWIGNNIRWIHQRREFIENPPTIYMHATRVPHSAAPWAPWPLWLFGERGWSEISISFVPWDVWEDKEYQVQPLSEVELAQLNHAKSLFPEAIVSTTPLDSRRANAEASRNRIASPATH